MRTLCIWDLQCFQSFRNCCLFCTFWLIRNFYSGHEQHVNYGKHSLNDHYQHCAHCAETFTVFSKCRSDLQDIQSFRNSCLFCTSCFLDIWTPLILTMLAMVNVVQINISNIAQSVYMRFTLSLKFAKLPFVLNILAYSKFLLRSWATC